MEIRAKEIWQAVLVILIVSVWLVVLTYAGSSTAVASPPDQGNEAKITEACFTTFTQDLEKRINERIDTIEGWLPIEVGGQFEAVILSVREPMRERLEKI